MKDFKKLTKRQTQIHEYIVTGLPNKKIALEMGLSEKTVRGHVSNVYMKLGFECRSELIAAHYKGKKK